MTDTLKIKKDWKYYLGIALFIYSWIPYIATGIIFFFKIPIGQIIAIVGGFLTSAEIAFAISVVLLGKTFIKLIKAKFIAIFHRHKVPRLPKPISKWRYYTGLTIFLLSFLPDILIVIFLFLGYPFTETGHMVILIIMLGGMTLFIAGLFILGSEFWGRLQNLFRYHGEDQTVEANLESTSHAELQTSTNH